MNRLLLAVLGVILALMVVGVVTGRDAPAQSEAEVQSGERDEVEVSPPPEAPRPTRESLYQTANGRRRAEQVRYSVPADPKAEYEILVNENLGDPLDIGEQRRLFLSRRTSTASARTLREFGLSRQSYSFRVVWCQPQRAAWYLGVPEGLTGFDDSVRPSESQIEEARAIARSIRISDIDGNPKAFVPGSSTTVAVNTACSGRAAL